MIRHAWVTELKSSQSWRIYHSEDAQAANTGGRHGATITTECEFIYLRAHGYFRCADTITPQVSQMAGLPTQESAGVTDARASWLNNLQGWELIRPEKAQPSQTRGLRGTFGITDNEFVPS